MKIRLAFGLLSALALSGCVVTTAPPASAPAGAAPAESHDAPAPPTSEPAAPPATQPRDERAEPPPRERPRTSHPAPRPQPAEERPRPPVVDCDASAPILYAETTHAKDDRRDTRRRLVVRASGAWSIEEGGVTRGGCLQSTELEGVQAALAAADFEPPAPHDVVCMAMPTERIVYEDPARNRRAHIERPCGRTPLNPSVVSLSRLVSALVEQPEAPEEPEVGVPMECNERAPLLASTSVGPVQRDRPAGSHATTEIRVATDGTWIRREGEAKTCGRLARGELQRLRAMVRDADIGTIRQEVVCRALPTRQFRLITSQGRAGWQTPCGADTPTDSARELARALMAITE
jgi:hypothetical protein